MSRIGTAVNLLPSAAAGAVAHEIWRRIGPRVPVHERERGVHDRAVVGELEVHGARVRTYRWGSGRRVILLVHGWHSRASRMGALVTALEGHATVVAFDAPANGDSGGRYATVLDYAEAIHGFSEEHGGLDAIVAHSFGVLSAFVAVREGAVARRIVGISGVHDADTILDTFASRLGLNERVTARLRRLIEERTFPMVDDPWARFTSRLDDASVPLLLVHDEDDQYVRIDQSERIAAQHRGPVELMRTSGLGHGRILGDVEVLAAVAEFVHEGALAGRV